MATEMKSSKHEYRRPTKTFAKFSMKGHLRNNKHPGMTA
jgi:hypothetical protein